MTGTVEQKLRKHFDERTTDLPTVGPGVPRVSDLRLTVTRTPSKRIPASLLAAAAVVVIAVGGLMVLSERFGNSDMSTSDGDGIPTASGAPDSPRSLQPAATLPASPDVSSAPATALADEPTDWYRFAPDLEVSWFQGPAAESPSMFCWRTPVEPDGICSVDAIGTMVVPLVVPSDGNQTLVLAGGDRSNPVLEITLDDGSTLSAPQDFDDELDWGVARFEVPAARSVVLVGGVEPPVPIVPT